MSYAVSGLVEEYRAPEYPTPEPMVPHGMSVILNAPSVFRFTGGTNPSRHLEAAQRLGADIRDAGPGDAGEVLAQQLITLMQATKMPNGLSAVGYTRADCDRLAEGSFPQKSLINNAPRETTKENLRDLYAAAMTYW